MGPTSVLSTVGGWFFKEFSKIPPASSGPCRWACCWCSVRVHMIHDEHADQRGERNTWCFCHADCMIDVLFCKFSQACFMFSAAWPSPYHMVMLSLHCVVRACVSLLRAETSHLLLIRCWLICSAMRLWRVYGLLFLFSFDCFVCVHKGEWSKTVGWVFFCGFLTLLAWKFLWLPFCSLLNPFLRCRYSLVALVFPFFFLCFDCCFWVDFTRRSQLSSPISV